MAQPPNTGASTRRATRLGPLALVAALLCAAAVGCSSSPEEAAAPPDTARDHRPLRAPQPLPDTRDVSLTPAAGNARGYPISVHGGDLVMGGSVTGPDGPVAGATVRLERFVGGQTATLDVRTNARGRWVAIHVHGGRYRFRAWQSPSLAMAASDVRFIAADAEVDLTLAVERYDGADVTGGIDDVDPEVDATAVVTGLVTHQQVDPEGIITTAPAAGRDARVTPFGPWQLLGPTGGVIDDAGRVSWTFRCEAAGSVSARIEALGLEATVSATCVEPVVLPPPVEEPEPDLPIGAAFTPPYAGPVPAGTYTVIDDPGTCVLTYEAWTGTGWDPARRTVTGTDVVTIPTIARNLEALGDSVPCTYERAS
ncbi:MAG TPA: carboxypeptidase-like regulatory domain-containing protein [Acidimicrobiales bacterium]|nr:carboxypeptidase-like regulatory domain-containing protein [Acidimicrobiales bacterium]